MMNKNTVASLQRVSLKINRVSALPTLTCCVGRGLRFRGRRTYTDAYPVPGQDRCVSLWPGADYPALAKPNSSQTGSNIVAVEGCVIRPGGKDARTSLFPLSMLAWLPALQTRAAVQFPVDGSCFLLLQERRWAGVRTSAASRRVNSDTSRGCSVRQLARLPSVGFAVVGTGVLFKTRVS